MNLHANISRAARWLAAVVGLLFLSGAVSPAAAASEAAAHAGPTLVQQFGYSYLTAFMFFLSLGLGSLFLVLLHHLFDAMWSVPIRRFVEHLSCLLFPWMLILFIPILVLAPQLYPWMNLDPHHDHALHVKEALFNKNAFYVVSISLFLIWGWLTRSLRRHSLAQDKTGAAVHTVAMRKLAAGGIFIFAFSLTLAAIYWMKSLQHQFFSTMYGVVYFAGSVWMTLAAVYFIAIKLRDAGPLRGVVQPRLFYDIGVLLFAFTVFYAYIHFSQYFLIWNAAVPEETFWYVLREQGSWKQVGFLIIFGHFVLPFLALLRIDVKMNTRFVTIIGAWAWLMHYLDMHYNIMPLPYPGGLHLGIFDPICLALIGGVLYWRFKTDFAQHPPYPQKDPRIAETMGVYVPPAGGEAASHGGAH